MTNRFAELETKVESARRVFIDGYPGAGNNTTDAICELSRDLQETIHLLGVEAAYREGDEAYRLVQGRRSFGEWLLSYFVPIVGMAFGSAVIGLCFAKWLYQP